MGRDRIPGDDLDAFRRPGAGADYQDLPGGGGAPEEAAGGGTIGSTVDKDIGGSVVRSLVGGPDDLSVKFR